MCIRDSRCVVNTTAKVTLGSTRQVCRDRCGESHTPSTIQVRRERCGRIKHNNTREVCYPEGTAENHKTTNQKACDCEQATPSDQDRSIHKLQSRGNDSGRYERSLKTFLGTNIYSNRVKFGQDNHEPITKSTSLIETSTPKRSQDSYQLLDRAKPVQNREQKRSVQTLCNH